MASCSFGTAKTILFGRRPLTLGPQMSIFDKKYYIFLIADSPNVNIRQQKQTLLIVGTCFWQYFLRKSNIFALLGPSDIAFSKEIQHFGCLAGLARFLLPGPLPWGPPLDPPKSAFFLIDLNRNHNDFDRLDFL